MKNFFKSVGKALLYFLAFLGIQVAVSFVFVMVYTAIVLLTDYSIIMEGDLFLTEVLSQTTMISIISNALSILVIWLFFVIRKKKLFNEIQLTNCGTKNIVASVMYGIGVAFVLGFIVELIPYPEMLLDSFEESYSILDAGNPVINFIAVAILAPIAEEIFFRGLIYTRLRRGMNAFAAIIISALLFGFAHGEIIWVISAFLSGVALAWIFEKTNSLLPCIIVHAVNNILAQVTENLPQPKEWLEFMITGVSAVVFAVSIILLIKNNKKTVITENCCVTSEEFEKDNIN